MTISYAGIERLPELLRAGLDSRSAWKARTILGAQDDALDGLLAERSVRTFLPGSGNGSATLGTRGDHRLHRHPPDRLEELDLARIAKERISISPIAAQGRLRDPSVGAAPRRPGKLQQGHPRRLGPRPARSDRRQDAWSNIASRSPMEQYFHRGERVRSAAARLSDACRRRARRDGTRAIRRSTGTRD
jgi:hypothetical protein